MLKKIFCTLLMINLSAFKKEVDIKFSGKGFACWENNFFSENVNIRLGIATEKISNNIFSIKKFKVFAVIGWDFLIDDLYIGIFTLINNKDNTLVIQITPEAELFSIINFGVIISINKNKSDIGLVLSKRYENAVFELSLSPIVYEENQRENKNSSQKSETPKQNNPLKKNINTLQPEINFTKYLDSLKQEKTYPQFVKKLKNIAHNSAYLQNKKYVSFDSEKIINTFKNHDEKHYPKDLETEQLYQDMSSTHNINEMKIEAEDKSLLQVNTKNIKKRVEKSRHLDVIEVFFINQHIKHNDTIIFHPIYIKEDIKSLPELLKTFPILSVYCQTFKKVILPILFQFHYRTFYIENNKLTILDSISIQDDNFSCGMFIPTYSILAIQNKVEKYEKATPKEKKNIVKKILDIKNKDYKKNSFGSIVASKIIELLEKAVGGSKNILDYLPKTD